MEEAIRCSEDNRVIIRVWTSEFNKTFPGENVGHISLETRNCYMSLWPQGNPNNKKIVSIIEKRTAQFLTSCDEDEKAEERKSQVTICLYSLNIKEIEKKFNQMKHQTVMWTLLGTNSLFLSSSNAHSCASLAYELLNAGDIYKLISKSNSSHPSISCSTTPDQLASIIIEAKNCELKLYRESRNYKTFERKSALYGTEKETSTTENNSKVISMFFRKHPYIAGGLAVSALGVLTYPIYKDKLPSCKIM